MTLRLDDKDSPGSGASPLFGRPCNPSRETAGRIAIDPWLALSTATAVFFEAGDTTMSGSSRGAVHERRFCDEHD
jgi:hypothetical protein